MYSIGRKYKYCPFVGKYMNESIYKGLYSISPRAEILIYELSISDEQYENIKRLLDKYGIPCKGYNFLGLVLAIFNKKINRRKENLSEFNSINEIEKYDYASEGILNKTLPKILFKGNAVLVTFLQLIDLRLIMLFKYIDKIKRFKWITWY